MLVLIYIVVSSNKVVTIFWKLKELIMKQFGQIASGIGQSKVVICCVSSEYVNSANCRMEIQFAVKSLKKPTIAIIVG